MSQSSTFPFFQSPGRPLPDLVWRLAAVVAVFLVGCTDPQLEAPEPAPVPVTTEVIEAAPFRGSVDLLGKIAPASRLEVRPPVAGRIFFGQSGSSKALKTGQTVHRGQVLFRIDNPDVELKVSEAELSIRAAETALERAKTGVEAGIMPSADLEAREIDAERARKRLENAVLEQKRLSFVAPIAGILAVEDLPAEGSEVAPDRVVARIAGAGARRIEAWVPARQLDRLQVGLEVELRLPRGGRLVGMASLVEVSQEVETGGVAKVVAETVKDLGMPRIGEGVDVRVLMPEKTEAITVAEQALVINGHVQRVYLLESSGAALRAVARLVQTGARSDGRVEIVDGLNGGERIAVSGAEYLAEGLIAEDVTESSGETP